MFPFPSVSAQLQAAPHAKGNKTPEVCPSLVPTGEIEGDDELRSLFLKLPAKKNWVSTQCISKEHIKKE